MGSVIYGFGEVIRSEEIRAIDINSEFHGVSRLQLMENAGRSIAIEVEKRVQGGASIVVYVGPGGNGGDGLVAARHLAYSGYEVEVILVSKPSDIRSSETMHMYKVVESMDLSIKLHHGLREPSTSKPDVVIDALLGVGLKGKPRPPFSDAIDLVNSLPGLKVAVDVPSGLDSDTGDVPGEAVRADITVTFHKPKPGLLKRRDLAGEIITHSIGVPPEAEIYVGPGDLYVSYPVRHWTTRKGGGGRVLVVGGSEEYIGAPILAALAAERVGVDLVYIASHPRVIAAASTHYTFIPITLSGYPTLHRDHIEVLEKVVEKADSVVVGTGLSISRDAMDGLVELFKLAAEKKKPVIVDADGLKMFREAIYMINQETRSKLNLVLTPHDREFEIIFGYRPESVEKVSERAEDVYNAVQKLVNDNGIGKDTVILLKGPVDVIASISRVRLNKTGVPAMSVGGTGDVLAGIIAGLLAKKIDLFKSAYLGAFINGVAGALAYKDKAESMTALDVIDRIHEVLKNPIETSSESLFYTRLPYKEYAGRKLWIDRMKHE